MIKIREERIADYDSVRIVNDLAFGTIGESRIVDKLRNSCHEILSLVAVYGEKIVGHIVFSPAVIKHDDTDIVGMALAPMAVLPELQKQGIGSMLVKEGLRILKETDCPFVIVLGHEDFYPRFGFDRASKYRLHSQWEGVPDEAFMVMILDKSVMAYASGVVSYRDEFNEVI